MGNIKEKQELLQPKRIEYACKQLNLLGYNVESINDSSLKIIHLGKPVIIYPYTGWFTGKTVKDGRGIHNLLKQLKINEPNSTNDNRTPHRSIAKGKKNDAGRIIFQVGYQQSEHCQD